MESRRTDRAKVSKTTIGLHRITKTRLDKNRAPGQCYDGFIRQLTDLWESAKDKREITWNSTRGGEPIGL